MSAAATSVSITMGLDYIVGLIVSLVILAYLVVALLWPEKF
jgi:K+-transporting ATPase KdpF subunit